MSITEHGILSVRQVVVKEQQEVCYNVKYSPDGKRYAGVFGNGCVKVFDTATNTALSRGKLGPQHNDLPSTSVKWGATDEDGTYNLASASSGGAVYGWALDDIHVERKYRFLEDANDTTSVEYSPDHLQLLSGGSDRTVRIYDLETKKLTQSMSKGVDAEGHSRPAHTNRIFSLKFVSPTTLLTAGWECPVQVWDMRTGKAERQIAGPQVSSDCIEPIPGTTRVMIASNRNSEQLQVYDYISTREIKEESTKLSSQLGRCHLSCARFSPEANLVWAVASKPDSVMCLDMATGAVKGLYESPVQISCADVCPTNPRRAIFGGAKENLVVIDADE